MQVIQQNTNLENVDDRNLIENNPIYEDFYNTFYNLDYPIYTLTKKGKSKSYSGFVSGFKWIKDKVMSKSDCFLSICNKYMQINKKNRAQNMTKNTRSARFFVIDLDSNYKISKKSAEKIIGAFHNLDFFEHCPPPTSIVISGSGFHFYYLIDEIFFPRTSNMTKKEYKKWLLKKTNLFKDTAAIVKNAVAKALENTTYLIKSTTYLENKILETLKVDFSVTAQTQQLIRAPGSYNTKSENYCTILNFNSHCKYTLTQLLQDYRPKFEKINDTNIFKFAKNGIYTKDDIIRLNKNRKKDMITLVELRKKNNTLKGTRQNLMANYAWILINTNNYLNTQNQVNPVQELLEFGKKIGDEFASERYCQNKIKHITTYHAKKQALSNQAMINFLHITPEELKELSTIKPNKDQQRKKKREEKKKKQEQAMEMIKQGIKKTQIAEQLGISRKTLYNWINMLS